MPITTSPTVIAKMAKSLVVLIDPFISNLFTIFQSKKEIRLPCRGNCYSRSDTHSKATKTKALSTLYDDFKPPDSIFSEEEPNFWIRTSPSVSVMESGTGPGTNPREPRGGTESDLKGLSLISTNT